MEEEDILIKYGKHYPNGNDAVEYLFSEKGTWKELSTLKYTYNFYEYFHSPKHPCDPFKLKRQAISEASTFIDYEGHLLFDKDGKCEQIVNPFPAGSKAFCPHTMHSIDDIPKTPHNVFRYEDNILGRIICRIYGKPEPDGLWPYYSPSRWAILGDHIFSCVKIEDFESKILDALYNYRKRNYLYSFICLQEILSNGDPFYDPSMQRIFYQFPSDSIYGMVAILAAVFIDFPFNKKVQFIALYQYMSLRSLIISKQVERANNLQGWKKMYQENPFIDTEATACCVLGLSAGADFVFEAGRPPLWFSEGSKYYIRDHNVISAAVEGGSTEGLLSDGPNWEFEKNKYAVDFISRSVCPEKCFAKVSVYSSDSNTNIAETRIDFVHYVVGKNWTRTILVFSLEKKEHLNFRCFWKGGPTMESNLDLACIRIRVID